MIQLIKSIIKQKVISRLLVICMILPIIPIIGVSATASGITYYEHNFELPLYGATGCPVKDVSGIFAGTPFTILSEESNNLKVKLQDGTKVTIAKAFCMINLPDVIPSIKYNVTNSYSSVFKVLGNNIAGITGTSLYQHGTSKKTNPRLDKDEFLVPVLYETAVKIAAVQKKALSEDYTLVVYEAYRPTYAQDKVYAAYFPLVTEIIRGDYPTSWFVAPGKSNHQEGYAVDLGLAKVTSVSFTALSNPTYKIASLTVTDCTMITPIHDLTVDSAVYNYQDEMVIYDKTAWQSYTKTDEFAENADCQRLQKYCTDAGLTPFAAEWWHFNDIDARNALGDLANVTGNWELATNMSILKAASVTGGGEILIESDDYDSSAGIVNYPYVIHLPDGGSRYPGAIVPSGNVMTSNGYYINEAGEKIIAFCIDPALPGAAEVEGGSYHVTLSEKLTDKFEIAALRLCERGDVNSLLYGGSSFANMDYWINYAVKIVVKFYEMTGKNKAKTLEEINNLIQITPPHGSDFIPTGDVNFGNKVISAIKAAYNWIIANENASPVSGNIQINCITNNLNELKSEIEFGGTYKGEFEVKIDGSSDAKFKVELQQGTGSHFAEFKLCDASGTPFPDGFAHEFTNGDHFWIIGNLPELEPNTEYKEEHLIKVTAAGEFGEEYWIGKPADNTVQRYVFITYNDEATKNSEFKVYDERPEEVVKFASLKIGKINSTTGEPVPGTKFLVEQIDGTYSTTVTVGDDGYYILDGIPKGTYKITEIYVPKPLLLDPVPKTIYIDPETAKENNPIIIEFVNDQMVCVHIYKYDSKTNELLNGAQFQLSRKDKTSALFTGITGESKCDDCGLCKNPCSGNGVICFGALDKGWYTVKEINSPLGYLYDPATPTVQTFEVTGKEIQEIELKYDNKRRPELEIIKVDSDGNPLDGVVFEIWKSGTTEKFTGTTQGGSILIEWDNDEYPLGEGSYSICEVSVPQGYILSNEIKEVMSVGNTRVSVTFTNSKRPGLTIEKQDENGQPLANVTFEIWKSGTQETFRGTTDSNGLIVFEWDNVEYPLDEGSYSIREVSVPQGYLLDSTVREINLVKNKMNSILFTNNKRPELEIVKINSAGEPLSGAVFTVKRAGTTTEYELITDQDGTIIIPFNSPLYPLESDRYIVTEKVPPTGYLLSSPNYQEVVLEPNARKTLTFENPEKPKLTIEKFDRRGDGNGGQLPLSGVTFRVWQTNGSYDENLTTDSNGRINITDLAVGEYHVKEISTKDGYVLNAETKTVILQGNDDVSVVFHNLRRPELEIIKLDGKTNLPLSGAHFRISKGSEVLFDDLITDENGIILIPYNDTFRLLDEGVYVVTETRAPVGYDIVLPASRNVILRNGERTRVEFNDIRKPTLVITKLNALTKKPIPNTLFNIKWENPSTGGVHDLGNWLTDSKGQIIFEFVEVGYYVITEIMPAPGMTKAKNPVTRIYLSPGTNAYSDDELRTPDNSSGENQNTSGVGENTINNNTNPPSGSGITVVDPFDNTQVISLPSHQYNSGGEITVLDFMGRTSGQAFELVTDVDTISDVTVSGITPDDSDPKIYVAFIVDEVDTTETVLSADEIEQREYNGSDEYMNPNYADIQIGSVGDVFTDNSGESYTFTETGFTPFNDNLGTIIDFPLNSIIIKKEDATNGNMLAGAAVEIYRMSDETSGISGTLIARLVTGNSGMLAVIGLEAGTYLVKEVKSPDNYTLNNQGTQTALFVPDNTSNIEFTFSNYPFGAILVDKIDAVSNKPLPGARFELKRADGSHVAFGTTDNYGHVTFGFLEPGAYIVAEQEAPNGYVIDTAPQTVHVPANGQMQTLYFKNQPLGSLIIVKKDAHLNTSIRGARFKITDIHGANIGDITPGNGFSADGVYTTDGDGVIRIDHIPQGFYLVTEIFAPEGYLIDESPKVVYAEYGKIKTCEFWNSRTGALVITKYDAVTKMPLKDAVFMVTDSKGAVVGESGGLYRTDDTGQIFIADLTQGSYRIYEQSAPQGYILDNTVKTIDILNEKMYYLEFFNEPVNSFTIMKYDADTRKPLAGAVVRVQKLGSTTTHIGDFETNVDGMIVIENLLPGAYAMQEIQAPKNYVLDNTVINISLEQNKPQVVTLYNKRFGDLLITKIDSKTKAPIEGVKFKVTKQDGAFIGEYVTDTDGYITINNLVPGFYVIQETECPQGYVRDITPKTIEIKSNELQTVQFVNKPKSRVHIRKLDADTGVGVEGAVFTVERGSTLISTVTSGINGEVEVGLLDPGDYVFTETTPPPNYTLNGGTNDIQRMTITDTDTVTVTFQNQAYGNMLIIKRDEFSNTPLGGAEFTVSHANGAFYGNYTTMIDGTILIPNIEPGIYLIRETRAPSGYLLDNAAKTVTVPAVVTTEVVFVNRPKSGLHINKIDSETRGALSGAEFRVSRPNGEVIGTKVTDISGTIIFDSLEPGNYIVTETRAPQGYVLDATSQTVVVTSDKVTTVYFENKPLSDIKIIKTDSVSKKPLSGATFKIIKPDGTLIGTYTTNVSGLIQAGDLVPGTYVVAEVTAPDGYIRDNVPKTVEVKSGKIAEVEFENKPLSGIKIIKTDSVTNKPLSGAKFKVSKINGEFVGNYVTSVAGDVIIPDLEPNSYNIQEIEAPSGYVADNATQTVEVKSGRLTEAEFLNDPFGSIDITKADSVTGAPLKNAVFKVIRALDNFEVGMFTTTVSGNVVVPNLIPGVYVISETKAPDNYVLDQTSKTVTLIKGTVTKAEFENRPYSGIQIIKKNSETGVTVAGAQFKVTKSNGELVGSYVTDTSGTVIIPNLAPGNYIVTEVKAPQYYVLDSAPKTVEVKSDKLATIEFMNTPYGNLVITKTDSQTGIGLKGAVFEVKRISGETIGRFTTGDDGVIIVRNLIPGAYMVTEVVAPAGYELESPPQAVQVGAGSGTGAVSSATGYPDGSTSMTSVSNNPYGTLEVVKLDSIDRNKALVGATFELRRTDGMYIATQITDVNGKAFFGQLKSGSYVITETVAPTGYEIDTASKNVTITAGNPASVTFYNNPHSTLEIIKTDVITHKALSGATFELTRADGGKVGTYKTDNTGEIIVSGLTEGVYIVAETIAPDNYIRDDLPKTVTIASGKITSVEFTNTPYGSITIRKTDEITGAPLGGAEFQVTKQNGEFIGNFTTAGDGTIIIPSVQPGYYVIGETKCPVGYILDKTPKTIEVKAHIPTVTTFTNRPLSGIQIIKTDAVTGEALAGATFEIIKANGEKIGQYKTDNSGKILVSDLTEGAYIISETAAPANYIRDELPRTVTVKSGVLTVAEFTNIPYGNLVIKKTDELSGAALAGAEFTVTSQSGDFVGTFITESAGAVVIPNLKPGNYIVGEIKAPTGYILSKTTKTVEVKPHISVAVSFTNRPLSGIQITKIDAVTRAPLSGAQFEVVKQNGEKVGSYQTDSTGVIIITDLAEGDYIINETAAPKGYVRDVSQKTVTVVSGKLAGVEFVNYPFGSLTIKKTDKITGKPLSGAHFEVYLDTDFIGEFETGADGTVNIPSLESGSYTIKEIRAPLGYVIDTTSKAVEVEAAKTSSITFINAPLSGIEILKTDAVTHKALAGATFEVTRANGEKVGVYKTDNAGKILVSDLTDGVYIVAETVAPNGYERDEMPQTVTVVSCKLTSVEFSNRPYSGLQILKTDSVSNAPLAGATFEVKRANGETVGTYHTDRAGQIIVSNLAEGIYVVAETIAPTGYVRDELPKNVTVVSGKLVTVEFQNKPYSGIEIVKVDYFTGVSLRGATFAVERADGSKIGEFTTDETGKVIVSDLVDSVYIVSEIKAPQGYVISEQPKTVTVKSGVLTSVKFADKPLAGIQIQKIDKFTKLPLSGATFEVTKSNGEIVGTFKTDKSGKIIIPDLQDGIYIVAETIAPTGYEIDEVPKTIEVKSGKLTPVEFENKPLSTLKILKLNSITREPIAGVEFRIAKMNGENLMNEFGSLTFKTDEAGSIYIPRLTEGYYTVTEIKAAEGYFKDSEPKTVLVQADRDTVLEITNIPMSGLLIVKTDEVTGKPLAGAVYDVKRADGQFVAGTIMDENQPGTPNNSPSKSKSENGDVTGSYTTDTNGRIQINGLAAGEYMVVERKAPNDYELDTNVYSITVVSGKMATLQLTNKPKSGLRLVKIDSITKRPIYNVEFMLFDRNNKVVGVYYTDNNGIIDFTSDINEGKYTIRETRAAQGYYLDEIPKTIEFVAGKVTEVVWENIPQLGQIQILKKSADDNEINGLPAGTPLENAIFEIYHYKTGALADRIVSGKDGRAVSNPLPLGRYVVKEVQAPRYYILSDKTLDIELEFATQIIKQEFLNYSANTGVSIRKTGNVEAMPNDVIRYDIREVRNTSSVPLTDFYWRDVLPTNAVRLNKIVTGSYNQSLKYKVTVTTNKGDTRVIADNLSTTKNNIVDCSPAALGLRSDEFVTSFSVIFGTVRAGFAQVEAPQVFVKVLPNLQNGLEFANKADVGGKHNGEWIVGNSVWTVKIFNPQRLPKTGF